MSRNVSSNILSLWDTPVTLGSLKSFPQEFSEQIFDKSGEYNVNLENPKIWESELIKISRDIMKSWTSSVNSNTSEVDMISLSIEKWNQGFEIPAYASREDIHGWLFLDGKPASHSDSGTVCIIDPRAGSDMCAVPGLPWGRPLILAPNPGAFAVVPGWMTSSVLPLEPGQESLVLRFSANLILK